MYRLLFFLLLLLPKGSFSQDKLLTELYDIDQGLCHSFITSLDEDTSGNIWLANFNCLQRFNGSDMRTFQSGQGVYAVHAKGMDIYYINGKNQLKALILKDHQYVDSLITELPDKHTVYMLASERSGHIWVADSKGSLLTVSLSTGRISHVSLPEKVADIRKMLYHREHIHLACNMGLVSIPVKQGKPLPGMFTTGLDTQALDICVKGEKLYVISLEKNLYEVDPVTKKERKLSAVIYDPARTYYQFQRACIVDGGGDLLYLISNEGPVVYDLKNATIRRIGFHKENQQPVRSAVALVMHRDRKGNLWMACDKGLLKHNPRTGLFANYRIGSGDQNEDLHVRCILKTAPETYWIGVENQGLYEVKKTNNGVYRVKPRKELADGTLNHIYKDSRKRLWLCGNTGVRIVSPHGIVLKQVNAAPIWHIAEKDGYVWALGRFDGILRIHPETYEHKTFRLTPFSNKSLSTWSLETDGSHFLISALSGLLVFSTSTLTCVEHSDRYRIMMETLKGERVWCCKKLDRDRFLVSTQTSGLYIFNLADQSVKNILNGQGGFFGIAISGNMAWVTHDNGLLQLDCNSLDYRIYTASDGLISNRLSFLGIGFDPEEGIAVCGTNGFTLFDPRQQQIFGDQPRFLTQLREQTTAGLMEGMEGETISLPYNRNSFSLSFAPMSFDEHANDRYSWRLFGSSSEWSVPSSQRATYYPDLPPGKYIFQVKQISGRIRDQPVSDLLYIEIIPAFWQTTLFRVFVILLLTMGLTYLIYNRLKSQKLKHLIEQNNLQTQVMALRSQINPHFMFNALNSIQHYIFTNNKENANHYMGKLSSLVRATLDLTGRHTLSIAEESAYLSNYLEMESMRYGPRLKWNIGIDEGVNVHAEIPTLIIQPFVENAIIHGLTPVNEGGKVDIRFRKQGAYLLVLIRDDGVGFANSPENKPRGLHGISLIQERILYINKQYGTEGSVSINSEPGHGTRVELKIPILHEYGTAV